MVHPILKQKERLGIYLVASLLVGGLMAFALAGPDSSIWSDAAALVLPLTLIYSFVCLGAWYPCWANPLPRTSPARALGVQVVAGLIASSVWLGVGRAWSRLLEDFAGFEGTSSLFDSRIPWFFASGLLLYLLAAALHYLLLAFEHSRRVESRALELKVLAREAELEAFKTQIDPHFIFNCLNSVSSLCGTDPSAARTAAIRLGDFLRASLRLSANDRIPLEQELRLVSAYLDVERIRYGDRLIYEQEVSELCLGHEVPALVLQPLVENALKHGIAQLLEGGTVRIEGGTTDNGIVLSITNPRDPDGTRDPGVGIGLANVRGRLRLLYDGLARLETTDFEDRYVVKIFLPSAETHA